MANADTSTDKDKNPAPAAPAGGGFAQMLSTAGVATPQERKQEAAQFLQSYEQSQAPHVQAMKDIQSKMQELPKLWDKIKLPASAKLEEPPTPPQPSLQNTMQALGGLGAVIAMFGGLATRAPLTSALNSGAAAMRAFHQGDLEKAKQEQINFEDKFREVLAHNVIEVQKFAEEYQRKNFDINKVMSQWHALAAQFQNESMLAATDAKNPEMAHQIFTTLQNSSVNLFKAGLQYKEIMARERETAEYHKAMLAARGSGASAAGAAPGDMSLKGDGYLQSLPPGMGDVVKAMADGRMPFPSSFAMRYPYWQSVIQALAHYEPNNLDVKKYSVRLSVQRDFTSGKSAINVTAINTAIGHMGSLYDLSRALKNNDVAAVNRIVNAVRTETGDPTVNNAAMAAHAVSSELMRVFRTVGASDQGVADFEKKLDVNKGPDVILGALKTGASLLDSRINALNDQWKRGMGTNEPFPNLLSPHSAQTLERLGVTPPKSSGTWASEVPEGIPAGSKKIGKSPEGQEVLAGARRNKLDAVMPRYTGQIISDDKRQEGHAPRPYLGKVLREPEAQPAEQPSERPSALSYINPLGVGEAALAVGSGMAAPAVGGLAGLGATIIPGSPGQGARVSEAVQHALTYTPRTGLGKLLTQIASLPSVPVGIAGNWMGEQGAKISPLLGALAKGGTEVAPLLLGLRSVLGVKELPPEVAAARESGMKLTPTEMGAGRVAKSIGSIANEPVLARKISAANQALWQKLVRDDVGIKKGDTLDRPALESIRKEQGKVYEALRKSGTVSADDTFHAELDQAVADLEGAARSFEHRQESPVRKIIDSLKKPATFDADTAVSEIINLRSDAKKAFASRDNELGIGALKAASALEDLLDRHVESMPGVSPEAVTAFKAARTQIAKTYAADKAMNPATGEINPQVYARALANKVPLSGAGKQIGELASAFPRSAQRPTHLPTGVQYGDVLMAAIRASGKAGLAAAKEIPFAFARPITRSALASDVGQWAMSPETPLAGYLAPTMSPGMQPQIENQNTENPLWTIPVNTENQPDIKASVEKEGWKYEPDKYVYRISPEGDVQRKRKQ